MQALVELFYRSEESARQQEAHTNEIIDHDLAEQNKQKEDEKREDEIEETVAKCMCTVLRVEYFYFLWYQACFITLLYCISNVVNHAYFCTSTKMIATLFFTNKGFNFLATCCFMFTVPGLSIS